MSGLPAGTGAITDIVAADDGTLWVAADNGVYHLHSGTWTGYPAGDDGPPLQLKKIAAGGDRVWVRAYGEIAVLAGDNWTRFSLPEEMYDLRILLVDAEGAVWLPSSSGAQRFDGESFTDLAIPAPPPIYIQGMTVDQAGAWWMATGDRLYRWMP